MLDDDPHMIFLHYYGRGQAATLAQGFRAALDVLGKRKENLWGNENVILHLIIKLKENIMEMDYT